MFNPNIYQETEKSYIARDRKTYQEYDMRINAYKTRVLEA